MRPRARILAAVLAAFLIAVPVAEAKRKVPHGFFGAVYSGDAAGDIEDQSQSLQRNVFNRMSEIGVESTRVIFNWSIAGRHGKNPALIDWSRTDSAVAFAAQHHMQMLATVMYAPGWARRYKNFVPSPPKNVSDYTDFLRQLIRRYGPKGIFWTLHPTLPKRPIRDWQVWNEVDLQFQWYRPANHWRPQDAADYGKLLRASYKAVHAEDHGAKLVLASLAIDSWRILRELYQNGGIKGSFDLAAMQIEAGSPSFLPTVVKRFRSALNDNGANSIPIWGTEFGWPASKHRTPPLSYATGYMTGYATTDQGMATRLRHGFPLLAKRSFRKRTKLQRVFWFTAVSPYRSDFEYDYSGLMRMHSGKITTKPAYNAYRTIARQLEGCSKASDGSCR